MICKCRKVIVCVQHTNRCKEQNSNEVRLTPKEVEGLLALLDYMSGCWVGEHTETVHTLREKLAK